MRHAARTLFALSLLAPLARADSAGLTFQVSKDAGASWHTFVLIDPGDTVRVRIIAEWSLSSGRSFWATTRLSQIDVGGSRSGDTAADFVGKLQPPTQTFALLSPGSPAAKIDRLDAPDAPIQFAQPPVASGGSPDLPVTIFSFTYTLSSDPILRDVRLGGPDSIISNFAVYTGTGSVQAPIAGPYTLTPAHIYTVPTPGALVMLGAPAMVRRRRPQPPR